MTQIEKIEAIIRYFENGGGFKDPEVADPDSLYIIFLVIDKLKETPDKYLTAYKNYLEFILPLLQRTTVRDTGDKPELNF